MRIFHHSLRFGDHLDLARVAGDGIHLLHARGRAVQVDLPAGWVSLCWPLHGHLALSAGGSEWTLPARNMQAWCDGPLRCRALGPHAWLVITAPAGLWDARSSQDRDTSRLLPWRGRIDRESARLFARLAREATLFDATAAMLFDALKSTLIERQSETQALLARCSGRTLTRRHQTLLRLLRVRHALECNPDQRLELDALAVVANYSPCHLIRVYRAVFGETPFEYAARLREQQAWAMVSGTGLPICEITEMLGFESQSAFCRAFKSAFGQTTSEVRRNVRQDDGYTVMRQTRAA